MLHRRRLLESAGLGLGGLTAQMLLPAWARSGNAYGLSAQAALQGTEFHLRAAHMPVSIGGKRGDAVTINGQLPAPLLRWREGDEVVLHLRNDLDTDTSIHWHGILLPPEMDGVPGVSFPGVKPGETFTYRFRLRQAGTYWYHSHSGLQEQSGLYGPLIIDAKDADPVQYDREHVIVLSDWTFAAPERVFAKLKKNSESYNFQKRTLVNFFRDVDEDGLDQAFRDRAMWGAMRMSPTDIADVTGETYAYLVNGHGPGENWTGLFNPGERVRLRIINASAMTIFNLRLPELPMTVVQADGLNVRPVETDEIQIGVAETYDVVIHPKADKAYTLMAESIDRSGYARATLAPREGMTAPVPPLRARPILTMRDMGMAGHGGHGGDHSGDKSGGHKGAPAMSNHKGMDHSAMAHGAGAHPSSEPDDRAGPQPQAHDHDTGVGVDMTPAIASNRLAEPGIGLENAGHRVLTYSQLAALDMNPDMRPPERELELHLTGNMHRYMWSFDGKKFSEVSGPILFNEGERLRLTLVNDTMMSHPIHLHGMFFDVVTGDHHHKPRKHTIVVKPAEKLSVDVTADAVGDWAFHCHLLYHMKAGMMRVVSVRPKEPVSQDRTHGAHDMHKEHGGRQ